MSPRVRLLALNWALDKPPARIHRICGDRVMDRGDNHQTLRADNVAKTHEGVIWKFINSTEELAEDEVDEVEDEEEDGEVDVGDGEEEEEDDREEEQVDEVHLYCILTTPCLNELVL